MSYITSNNRLITVLTANLTGDGIGADSISIPTIGMIHAIELQGATFTSGTLTIDGDTNGITHSILTTTANQDYIFYIRTIEHDSTGGDLISYTYPVINGDVVISVTSVGIAEVGVVYIHMLENA